MNFEVVTKEEIGELLKSQLMALKQLLISESTLPEWLNDEQCWKVKGGCALNTFRTNRYYQPKGGIPDGYVGGRKVWSKATVMEWMQLTDDKLPEYHQKYKTGAKK